MTDARDAPAVQKVLGEVLNAVDRAMARLLNAQYGQIEAELDAAIALLRGALEFPYGRCREWHCGSPLGPDGTCSLNVHWKPLAPAEPRGQRGNARGSTRRDSFPRPSGPFLAAKAVAPAGIYGANRE